MGCVERKDLRKSARAGSPLTGPARSLTAYARHCAELRAPGEPCEGDSDIKAANQGSPNSAGELIMQNLETKAGIKKYNPESKQRPCREKNAFLFLHFPIRKHCKHATETGANEETLGAPKGGPAII